MAAGKISLGKWLKVGLALICAALAMLALIFGRYAFWFMALKDGFTDFDQGKLALAEKKLTEATDLARGFSEKEGQLPLSLNALAAIYMAEAKYDDAEKAIKEGLALAEKQQGKESMEAAVVLNIYAGFYRRQGKYDQALPIYARTLEILEKADKEQGSLAETLTGVAKLNVYLGRVKEANLLYQRAYEILTKKFKPDSAELVGVNGGFGLLDEWAGNYKKAEDRYSRAIHSLKYNEKMIDRAAICTYMAYLKYAEGKGDQALGFSESALHTTEQNKGMAELYAADSNAEVLIAEINLDKGDLKGARERLDEALKTDESRLGPSHPNMAKDLRVQALLESQSKDYDKALATSQKAIAVYDSCVGHKHRWVAQALGEQAGIYADKGDRARAEETFKQALAMEAELMPAKHPDRAALLRGYSKLLAASGCAGQAKEMTSEADQIMADAMAR